MAWQKAFVFDPQDLMALLTHYTDGEIPLDAEVGAVGFHPHLTRMIGLEVKSKEWETMDPLHIRYEGKRVMSWSKGKEGPVWDDTPDTPSRQ